MKEIFEKIHRYKEQDFQEGKPFEFTLDKATKELKTEIEDYTWKKASKMEVGKSYRINVKKYMTEPSTPNFDFQDKWNDGKPMPLCIMQGKVTKETRGMFHMELKADDIRWTGFVIKSAIKEWEEI